MAGRFISFEGIDGAGKTTHIAGLAEHFRRSGAAVVTTREPGGTPLAEAVRGLLLAEPMDGLTESLLVFAARRDHLRGVIEPALARGDTVLCDRFTDASFAYQGGGHGVDTAVLRMLEGWVHGKLQPDLTLWFDVAVPAAAQRRGARQPDGDSDRFERQGEAFFERVRAGYAQRLAQAPGRIVRIDASLPADGVWRQVLAVLAQRGW